MPAGDTVDFGARVQQLIYQLVRNHELCDQVCLSQYGVTASQGYTLLSFPHSGELTMNDLSERMDVAGSTMTRMIDQLVNKGLVSRRPDEKDRRVVLAGLTTFGQEKRQTLDDAIQGFFQQAVGSIPEEERPVMLKTLERVNKLLVTALASCCRG